MKYEIQNIPVQDLLSRIVELEKQVEYYKGKNKTNLDFIKKMNKYIDKLGEPLLYDIRKVT